MTIKNKNYKIRITISYGEYMNYSRQREIILNTLKEYVVHPTAESLYSKIKEKDPKISLATLYRNLNQLADNGIIKKIDGLEDSAHYDHNTGEHYHFICKKCKRVFDVKPDVAPDLIRKTEDSTGFLIENHDVVFSGVCKDCRESVSN